MGEEVEKLVDLMADAIGDCGHAAGRRERAEAAYAVVSDTIERVERERDEAREATLILKGDPLAEAVYRKLRAEKEDARRHADSLEGIWRENCGAWQSRAQAAEAQVEAMRKLLEQGVTRIRCATHYLTWPGAQNWVSDVEAALASSTPESRDAWRVAKVGKQITISPADPDVGNACVSPDQSEPGCYWTLIGGGSEEEQNALAQVIADALNATVKAEESEPTGDFDPRTDPLAYMIYRTLDVMGVVRLSAKQAMWVASEVRKHGLQAAEESSDQAEELKELRHRAEVAEAAAAAMAEQRDEAAQQIYDSIPKWQARDIQDRADALERRVEDLRAALKPFAEIRINSAPEIVPNGYANPEAWREDVRRARAALSAPTEARGDQPEANRG